MSKRAVIVEFDDDGFEGTDIPQALAKFVSGTAIPVRREFGRDYRGMAGEPLSTGFVIPSRSAGVYQRWVTDWETIDALDWNELGAIRSGRSDD